MDDTEKKWRVALAVGLIDHTFERVGNDQSAEDGHFGVSGWRKKHITFGKGTATIRYVGKSGVKHEKVVDDPLLIKALRRAIKDKGENDEICGCTAADVNAYLKPFDVSAKDLRGYHANTEMQEHLKAIRSKGGKLPEDKKEREKKLKAEFKQALEETAEAVGHEPATLKSQYLVPGLEDEFLGDGKVTEKLTKKKGSVRVATSLQSRWERLLARRPDLAEKYATAKPATPSQISYAKHLLQQQGLPEPDWTTVDSLEVSTLIDGLKSKRGKPVWYGNGQFSHWQKAATKTTDEKEEESAEDLIKPAPKKKPPRHDLRNERVDSGDKDTGNSGADKDPDLSLNYKRVAAEWLWARVARLPRKTKKEIKKHKPGTTWKTDSGWAGMNSEGVARYKMDSEESASAYAKGKEAPTEEDEGTSKADREPEEVRQKELDELESLMNKWTENQSLGGEDSLRANELFAKYKSEIESARGQADPEEDDSEEDDTEEDDSEEDDSEEDDSEEEDSEDSAEVKEPEAPKKTKAPAKAPEGEEPKAPEAPAKAPEDEEPKAPAKAPEAPAKAPATPEDAFEGLFDEDDEDADEAIPFTNLKEKGVVKNAPEGSKPGVTKTEQGLLAISPEGKAVTFKQVESERAKAFAKGDAALKEFEKDKSPGKTRTVPPNQRPIMDAIKKLEKNDPWGNKKGPLGKRLDGFSQPGAKDRVADSYKDTLEDLSDKLKDGGAGALMDEVALAERLLTSNKSAMSADAFGYALAVKQFAHDKLADPSTLQKWKPGAPALTKEDLAEQSKASFEHFSKMSPDLRADALKKASKMLDSMEPDDPARPEYEKIVDGLHNAAIVAEDSEEVLNESPRKTSEAQKHLIRSWAQSGQDVSDLGSTDTTDPVTRHHFREHLDAMSHKDLVASFFEPDDPEYDKYMSLLDPSNDSEEDDPDGENPPVDRMRLRALVTDLIMDDAGGIGELISEVSREPADDDSEGSKKTKGSKEPKGWLFEYLQSLLKEYGSGPGKQASESGESEDDAGVQLSNEVRLYRAQKTLEWLEAEYGPLDPTEPAVARVQTAIRLQDASELDKKYVRQGEA